MSLPLLALDVSSGPACACLILDDKQQYCVEAEAGLQHSQTVLPLLEGLMQQANISWDDLNMLALSQGPGSFTGLRIAASILAGINASRHLPIWGLSSLAITATQTASEQALWVLEDARAGEVFVGHYQQGKALQGDICKTWDDISSLAVAAYCSHQAVPCELKGWQRIDFQYSRSEALALCLQRGLKNLDINQLSEWIEPVYLQLSQAEKNLQHG